MTWHLVVAWSAQKELERAPARDRTRILGALKELAHDPCMPVIIASCRNLPKTRK